VPVGKGELSVADGVLVLTVRGPGSSTSTGSSFTGLTPSGVFDLMRNYSP
jgi:hypothetical protein